ncbi:MAG: sugar phosphate isomerase/epimerase [Planctomycetes bacterium]|nr:sugar phosphate isomerase/epimerase [Planctomycetota bacterium]
MITRRQLLQHTALTAAAVCAPACGPAVARADDQPAPFRMRHLLASALYGDLPLAEILPEVAATGCDALDVWCKVHGTQREQATTLGDEAFAALLKHHGVRLGCSTKYPGGPTKQQEEMAWVKRHGGSLIVTGSRSVAKGQPEPSGDEAKAVIRHLLDDLAPHLARAAELDVTLALENHTGQILCHPDSLRYFAEFNRSPHLGVSFAPHQLFRWADQIPSLIRDLGAAHLPHVYFQEESPARYRLMAKEIELQQLPGFGGGLDYQPLIQALRDVHFTGWVELFMHPTPRGQPILPTIPEIRAVLAKARSYIDGCVAKTAAR